MEVVFNKIVEIAEKIVDADNKKFEDSKLLLIDRFSENGIVEQKDFNDAAMLYAINSSKKQVKNMAKIMSKTLVAVETDNKTRDDFKENLNHIDNDWMETFFDKARLISDDKVQNLWASMLKSECFNRTNGIRKAMLDKLALLDRESAIAFSNLCKLSYTMRFKNADQNDEFVEYPVPFYIFGQEARVYFEEHHKGKNPMESIYPPIEDLEILNDIGLITFNMEAAYADVLYGIEKTCCEFLVDGKVVYEQVLYEDAKDYLLSLFTSQVAFSKLGLTLFKVLEKTIKRDDGIYTNMFGDILKTYFTFVNEEIIA